MRGLGFSLLTFLCVFAARLFLRGRGFCRILLVSKGRVRLGYLLSCDQSAYLTYHFQQISDDQLEDRIFIMEVGSHPLLY